MKYTIYETISGEQISFALKLRQVHYNEKIGFVIRPFCPIQHVVYTQLYR